jgi:hypothetical protein
MEGAPYRPGDAVIAFNGKPITTREAAQDFAFPRVGLNTLQVRRWSGVVLSEHTWTITVTDDCGFRFGNPESKNLGALGKDADRVSKIPPPPQSPDPTSQIGFAVSCTPSCSRITGKDGNTFWKHDGYPAIVAVRAKSPAAEAGLQIGDLIAEVNGLPVTNETGSRMLQIYASMPITPRACVKCEVPVLNLLLIRDGERRTVTLRLVEARD